MVATDAKVGDAGAKLIGASDRTGTIQKLDLSSCDITDVGVKALAQSTALRPTQLILPGNAITAEGVQELFATRFLSRISYLNLDKNPIGDDGTTIIANSAKSSSLVSLSLWDTQMTESGFLGLLHSPYLTEVRILVVSPNVITSRTLTVLMRSQALPELLSLAIIPAAVVDSKVLAALKQARPSMHVSANIHSED